MEKIKLILEDGKIFFENERKEILFEKKEYYKIERDNYIILDLDKHKIRPYVKDLLNRQNKFVEIKYLTVLIFACVGILIAIISTFAVSPGKSYFEKQNAIFLQKFDEIVKSQKQQQITVPQTIPEVQTGSEQTPIIHHNIPKKIQNDFVNQQGGL